MIVAYPRRPFLARHGSASRLRPSVGTLDHSVAVAMGDRAAGDHRAAPVLASTPRSNLAVGRPVDVAATMAAGPPVSDCG